MSKRLRITLNLGHEWPPFKQDQIVLVPQDLNEEMANRLLARSLAVVAEEDEVKDEEKPKRPEREKRDTAPGTHKAAQVRKTGYQLTPPVPAAVNPSEAGDAGQSEEKKAL